MQVQKFTLTILGILFSIVAKTNSYNSIGQVGLINLPSAELKESNLFILLLKRMILQS